MKCHQLEGLSQDKQGIMIQLVLANTRLHVGLIFENKQLDGYECCSEDVSSCN